MTTKFDERTERQRKIARKNDPFFHQEIVEELLVEIRDELKQLNAANDVVKIQPVSEPVEMPQYKSMCGELDAAKHQGQADSICLLSVWR